MSLERPLVVIAAGDAVAATVYQSVLEAHGYDVEAVLDGFEAVDVTFARRPAAIVFGDYLGVLDAPAICRLFKSRRATDAIPTIVVTSDDAVDEGDMLECGADAVLADPPAPELIAIEVKRLVADAGSRPRHQPHGRDRRAGDARAAASDA